MQKRMPNNFEDTDPVQYAPSEIPNPIRPLQRTTGWVFEGRGSEAHGVDPNLSPPEPVKDVFDQHNVIPLEEKEPERHEVPTPVRIVSEGAKEDKQWRVLNSEANANPTQIVGKNRNRTNLIVHNAGAVTIFAGPDGPSASMFGFPIPAGSQITLSGYGAVYAVSSDGSTQPVNILMEYVVEI